MDVCACARGGHTNACGCEKILLQMPVVSERVTAWDIPQDAERDLFKAVGGDLSVPLKALALLGLCVRLRLGIPTRMSAVSLYVCARM